MGVATVLEVGRERFEQAIWSDAYAKLSAADRVEVLAPADLERLAIAAYLTGHDDVCEEAWTRAHRSFLDGGDGESAARCAFWLGLGLLLRGEMSRGGGWLARTRRILDDHALDSALGGYLLVPTGLGALGQGDASAALAMFADAAEVGRRFHDADLCSLAWLGQGQALLRQGRLADGCALCDEAMVAVVAGEVSPVVSGIVYCAVVDECQRAHDVRRAREWTVALSRWCESQPGLVLYQGQCLVHRSQILQLDGDWAAALEAALRARERLSDPWHPAIGAACYQLGELHRLRGEVEDAEDAYRLASQFGHTVQPGLALLRLAQGRLGDACAAIDRALVDARGEDVGDSDVLFAGVEVMLASERVDDARRMCDALTACAPGDASLLQALADHARGHLLLVEGDPQGALVALHHARSLWTELAAPYSRARTQVLIAQACRAIGDDDTARLESDAARATFVELGAVFDIGRTSEETSHADAAERSGLTPRELDVLVHLASGRTNREIAAELVISEKTVARHVSNIFRKMGVSSRSAATAFAYENGLV